MGVQAEMMRQLLLHAILLSITALAQSQQVHELTKPPQVTTVAEKPPPAPSDDETDDCEPPCFQCHTQGPGNPTCCCPGGGPESFQAPGRVLTSVPVLKNDAKVDREKSAYSTGFRAYRVSTGYRAYREKSKHSKRSRAYREKFQHSKRSRAYREKSKHAKRSR